MKGLQLKGKRVALGLTQADCAKMIEKSTDSYAKKERNEVYFTPAEIAALTKGLAAEQLASQLDVAMNRIHEFAKTDKDGNPKPIKAKVWEEWARLVSTEIRLLKALKKSLQGKYNIKE